MLRKLSRPFLQVLREPDNRAEESVVPPQHPEDSVASHKYRCCASVLADDMRLKAKVEPLLT